MCFSVTVAADRLAADAKRQRCLVIGGNSPFAFPSVQERDRCCSVHVTYPLTATGWVNQSSRQRVTGRVTRDMKPREVDMEQAALAQAQAQFAAASVPLAFGLGLLCGLALSLILYRWSQR